jgi:hypothetical protein
MQSPKVFQLEVGYLRLYIIASLGHESTRAHRCTYLAAEVTGHILERGFLKIKFPKGVLPIFVLQIL